MPTFLVESYLPNAPAAAEDACERARAAAACGDEVQHVRTTYLPRDELVMHVFEAPTDEAVRRALDRAGLPYERVVEAVDEANPGISPVVRTSPADLASARTPSKEAR